MALPWTITQAACVGEACASHGLALSQGRLRSLRTDPVIFETATGPLPQRPQMPKPSARKMQRPEKCFRGDDSPIAAWLIASDLPPC